IAADRYVRQKTDDYFDLDPQMAEFQRKEAFSGMELVKDTHRLALMNALLHSMEGRIEHGDSLSNAYSARKFFHFMIFLKEFSPSL
ncbi:N-6 DNA methylase, partial [Veillonella atypica]|uniref:N-6 DNA methylase n=1 Tax=Veillonella atypica TaxID=39777 RepID=UPI001D075729